MQTARRVGSSKLLGGGIWSQILQQAARTAEFPNSHLLLLGGRDVGKTSILNVLQKTGFGNQKVTDVEFHQDNYSVSALDYAYLNVRNVDDEDTTESLAKMNVWILQHIKHQEILQKQFRAEFIKHAAVMICLDLSKPWSILDELIKWLDFVAEFVPPLLKNLTVDEQEVLRDKLAHYNATYKRNTKKETAEDFAKRHAADENADDDLDGFTLKINLGVPIVVCVCKSDYASSLDTRTSQGHIDVVEAHLRQICLPYGAALVFCSAKDGLNARNLDLLYRYLMHRVHNFDFGEEATNDQKDAIFIPSGWDTEEEINEFAKSTIAEGFQRPFGSIINRNTSILGPRYTNDGDSATRVEDMNAFLGSALAQTPSLAATPPMGGGMVGGGNRDREATSTPLHARERRSSRGPAGGAGANSEREVVETSRSSVRRSDVGSARQQGDSASLRSFFQTLLVKKQPNSPRNPTDGASAAPIERGGGAVRQQQSVDGGSGGAGSPKSPPAAAASGSAGALESARSSRSKPRTERSSSRRSMDRNPSAERSRRTQNGSGSTRANAPPTVPATPPAAPQS